MRIHVPCIPHTSFKVVTCTNVFRLRDMDLLLVCVTCSRFTGP